jgi:glycosyltransferase involved in cell wall biosynthesis
VRALEREGHVVRVVAPKSGGAFGWPGVAARVRESPRRVLEAMRWTVTTSREASQWDCDRVIAHWAIPSALPIAMRARADLEIVSHGGDVRFLRALPSALRASIVRALAARASSWRFVSDRLRDDLVSALASADARRVLRIARVAPSAIDVPDVRERAAVHRASLGDGAPVAIAVARLVPAKRVDRAVAHAADKRMRLVVVGDGPERSRLEARAIALGVDARFLGKIKRIDALAWIAAADVLVHASRDEGLSTVVREAAALGTRVECV